jgi:hypothetical protein
VQVYPHQLVLYWVPPKEEEDEEAVEAPALPVEEYQPPVLSEEEALRRAIEKSKLIELANWVGVGAQLAAFVSTSDADTSTTRAAPPPPPPPPEPQPSGYAVGAASRASHSGELGPGRLHRFLIRLKRIYNF